MKPWIQTYTAKAFDLLNPKPEMVDIIDIAKGLSQLCRFTGQCREHYSVAQHSCLVAHITRDLWRAEYGYYCPPSVMLAALLHDAAEAYTGDKSTPLKAAMREIECDRPTAFDKIYRRVESVVLEAFGVTLTSDHAFGTIKRADSIALATEHRALFDGPEPMPWGDDLPAPWSGEIVPWPAKYAEASFLRDFDAYGGVR